MKMCGKLAETCGKLAETCRKGSDKLQKRAEAPCRHSLVFSGSCQGLNHASLFPVTAIFTHRPCALNPRRSSTVFQVEFMSCRSGCHDEASIYVSTASSSSLRSFAPLRGVSNLQTLRNWPLALIAFCRRTFYHRKFIKAFLISVEGPYPPPQVGL